MIEIEIFKGSGEFNIVGTKDCSTFEFRHRPKILVWEMNWNSLYNFFVGKQAKQRILYLEYIYQLEAALNNGTLDENNCKVLLEPLLNQFTNAIYRIEIEEINGVCHIIYPGEPTYQNKEKTKSIVFKSIWAGGDPLLYSFQKHSDTDRIEFYKKEIQNGLRPHILVMQTDNSNVKFLLDGHHKLNAYKAAKVHPNIVRITKMNNYCINDDRIIEAFDKLESDEDLRRKLLMHLAEVGTLN